MLRIQDDAADAVRASLTMASTCLRAGRQGAAQTAIDTAIAIMDKDLEPSRATRGQARPESRKVKLRPAAKRQRTGSVERSMGALSQ